MRDQDDDNDELQMLRDMLLRPMAEQNKVRDQKIMEFIEQFSTELATRLNALEQQVADLSAEINSRDTVVSDIGEGIASLGQQLRQLASKAGVGQSAQEPKEAPKSAKA